MGFEIKNDGSNGIIFWDRHGVKKLVLGTSSYYEDPGIILFDEKEKTRIATGPNSEGIFLLNSLIVQEIIAFLMRHRIAAFDYFFPVM